MLRGESVGEQDRGPGVDGEAAVQLIGGDVLDAAGAAAGVVHHQPGQRAGQVPGLRHQPCRCGGIGEVGREVRRVPQVGEHGRQVVPAPRLLAVVRRPGVDDDRRPPSRSLRATANPMPLRRLTPVTSVAPGPAFTCSR